ncbi:MAG: nucleotide exchange factor GrpE [Treponema sp.]|jgi:molecular chaperone GrpE|nr:nucleotide exchange factor GrpE [Treponema sp.]
MSIQHNDSKEGSQGATALETENFAEDAAQTDGQNTVTGNDSAPETGENATERVPPGVTTDEDSANESEKTPDSAEDAETKGESCPDAAQADKKIAELEVQLAETRDQLLRKAADFENFRKRMNQEKQNAIEFANQTLLLDIIPIIDDFERAIQSAQNSAELAESPAGKAMLDGITLIEKRLTGQLESKWGLKRFNSAGEPFDPNRHEAMMMEKSPGVEEPLVQEEYSKGYTLKDRVIRAAQVKVVMPEGN